MAYVEERTRLEQAYLDALGAYVEVLATLHTRLLAGRTSSEDIRLELDARSRLDAACRECCDA
jgi:hypothetical protein